MKVLMFGWEFPPHIAGGLGTACEGIVKGLAHNGVETLFVMPSASGDEDQSCATILNASDVAVQHVSDTVEEFLDKVKFINVDSNIVPYVDPASARSSSSPASTAPTSSRRCPATPRWAAPSRCSTPASSTSSTPTTG